MSEQRVIHFSGNVQGVGFRWTARQTAGGYDLTGYVQNLPDGRVRCVAEGEPREIDAFLDDLSGRMGHYIREVQQDSVPASGQYPNFGVRH